VTDGSPVFRDSDRRRAEFDEAFRENALAAVRQAVRDGALSIEELDWVRRDYLGQAQPAELDPVELLIVDAIDFAGVDEPGGAPILGEQDDAVLTESCDAMVYGDGGAGKTTLCLDLACHLATGRDWLDLKVPSARRVLWIENEGPRPLFRRKLKRKLDFEKVPRGAFHIVENPWGRFTFASDRWREEVAQKVMVEEIDVIFCGPLARVGMDGAGTLQEVVAFMQLVADLRARSERPLCVTLIHHENKGGAVSGAWEGAGDTLLHVTAARPGHTVLFVQKARWATSSHGQTLKLAWTDGESYAIESDRDLKAEAVALLSDGVRRTKKEIAGKLKIGETTAGEILADPELFDSVTGAGAAALNRRPTAILWGLRENSVGPLSAVDAVTLLTASPEGADGYSATALPLTQSGNADAVVPAPSPGDVDGVGVDAIESVEGALAERAEDLLERWDGRLDEGEEIPW
jgi:hypothetical protein